MSVDANEKCADDASRCIGDGLVRGDVLLAEKRRDADIGLACKDRRIRGALAVEQRADRARAVLLLERRRHAHEIVPGAGEDRRDGAAFLEERVGNREVVVQRLIAREESRRGFTVDVHGAGFIERERRRQTMREDRHEARDFRAHGLVEEADHRRDRAILAFDARERMRIDLLARAARDGDGEERDDDCRERAGEHGEFGPDVGPGQNITKHGESLGDKSCDDPYRQMLKKL